MRSAILLLFCVATAYGQQKGGTIGNPSLGGLSRPGSGPNVIGGAGPSAPGMQPTFGEGAEGGPGATIGGSGVGPSVTGGPGMGAGGGGGIGPGGPIGGSEPTEVFGENPEGEIGGGGGIVGFGSDHGQLDLFTLLLRQIFLAYGADPLKLPEMTLPFSSILRMSGTVRTFNSFVYGLSHVKRTGPCFVTADHSGMRLGLDLGITDVFGNSSATVTMNRRNIKKQLVHFTVIVKKARAILEIAQTGPHEIHVTNFKILFLQGFRLFLKPHEPSRKPLFRTFLRAAQSFLERSVKKRLEPLVRKAVDDQIKQVLAYLNRQAELRPKPRLPPELFTGAVDSILDGGAPGGAFPSGRPSGVGPGVGPGVGVSGVGPVGPAGNGPSSAGGMLPSGGPSNAVGGVGSSLSGLGGGPSGPAGRPSGPGIGSGNSLAAGGDMSASLPGAQAGLSGQQKLTIKG
ncbi:uncharacterized protein [Dermacentor andersoni]|uniref:uncharacterized protein n=1 Tax=Dermacentor andersoni TaxID=34620 RepID=UPI003B3B2FF3